MLKSMIGLGVLSIPSTFDSLGIIPGVICLCTIAVITTWSDYMVGAFKISHPSVYNIDDVGRLIFGRIGREVMYGAFVLCQCHLSCFIWLHGYFLLSTHRTNKEIDWFFVAGSGMLGISIGLNSVSSHGTCTAVFVAVAAIIGFMLGSIRTLGRISWLAWVGLVCIMTASMYEVFPC